MQIDSFCTSQVKYEMYDSDNWTQENPMSRKNLSGSLNAKELQTPF